MYIDGHEDIAYNVLTIGRDFVQPSAVARAREGDSDPETGACTTSLPELLAGGVGVVFGTLFTLPATATGTSISTDNGYHTPDEAHQQALDQLNVYRRLAQRNDVRLVANRADLATVSAAWEAGTPQLGIVPLMENADPIRTPDEALWWFQQGLRIVGPAWQGTRYCGGTGAPGPLTADGRALMGAMADAGLILDMSHIAEESFWQALDLFDGPTVASHSNCRALVQGRRPERQLSDDQIRALIERDGIIGVVLYGTFLQEGWTRAAGKQALSLADVIRHVDHICQIAGDARHVAIGSDFDGGFGSESIPRELDTVADWVQIGAALRAHGFSAGDADGVLGDNWLRLLQRALPQ
jgi:membrane dipeptidase